MYCDICKTNPVKVRDTKCGDICWFCYYKICFGDVKGMEMYIARFGKDGVKDEKNTKNS